jgi:hypothetical protein
MLLLQIMPDSPGFDSRTFECGKCDAVVTVKVVADPMKSDRINRLADSLKPPH